MVVGAFQVTSILDTQSCDPSKIQLSQSETTRDSVLDDLSQHAHKIADKYPEFDLLFMLVGSLENAQPRNMPVNQQVGGIETLATGKTYLWSGIFTHGQDRFRKWLENGALCENFKRHWFYVSWRGFMNANALPAYRNSQEFREIEHLATSAGPIPNYFKDVHPDQVVSRRRRVGETPILLVFQRKEKKVLKDMWMGLDHKTARQEAKDLAKLGGGKIKRHHLAFSDLLD